MIKNNGFIKMEYKDGGVAFSAMISLYIFIVFIGQAILSVTVQTGSVIDVAIKSLFSSLSMFIVLVYYSMNKRGAIKDLAKIKRFDLKSLILCIFLSLGMLFGLGVVNGLFIQMLFEIGLNVNNFVLPFDGVGSLVLFLFVFAVFPSIIEEMFFRGLLLNSLSKAKPIVSVMVVSICFALYHCSATQLVYQIIYGAGLTLLAMYAKSTIPCIIAHFINNATVILLEYFKVSNIDNVFSIVGGIIFLVIFSFIVVKKLKEQKIQGEKAGVVKQFLLPYGVLGVAVCVLMILVGLIPVA